MHLLSGSSGRQPWPWPWSVMQVAISHVLIFLRSLQGYIYMASQLGFWPFPSLIGWHCLARQRPAKTMINWTQIENYPSWWIDVRRTLKKRVGVWCKSNKVTRYWLTQILTHKCANAPNKMDYMFPIWYSNGDILQLKKWLHSDSLNLSY